MTFSEKLKQAMQELHLNQRQVCGMTGKSKGSVSQYLSGKQIPSEDVQSAIAVALGLESDYFSKSDEQVVVLPTAELRNGVIPRLDVEKAAKLLQMNHNTVRKGLQQGVFPWGYGIHTSDNRWVYFIKKLPINLVSLDSVFNKILVRLVSRGITDIRYCGCQKIAFIPDWQNS